MEQNYGEELKAWRGSATEMGNVRASQRLEKQEVSLADGMGAAAYPFMSPQLSTSQTSGPQTRKDYIFENILCTDLFIFITDIDPVYI